MATTRQKEAVAVAKDMMDEQRAALAAVVMRIRRLNLGEGEKYHWPEVEVLKVLKNESGHRFGTLLRVAHYSSDDGIPAEVCTVYLVPYGDSEAGHWSLLGGTADKGVSHVSP